MPPRGYFSNPAVPEEEKKMVMEAVEKEILKILSRRKSPIKVRVLSNTVIKHLPELPNNIDARNLNKIIARMEQKKYIERVYINGIIFYRMRNEFRHRYAGASEK